MKLSEVVSSDNINNFISDNFIYKYKNDKIECYYYSLLCSEEYN